MKALVAVCLLSGVASADEPAIHDRLLGMRIGFGTQTFHDLEMTTMSVELGAEHRVASQLRIAAEYEYVFLGIRDTEADHQHVTDGSGHRASLIVRHHLVRSPVFEKVFRFYVDAEAGAGFLLGTEPMIGRIAKPHALAGIRIGYDLIKLRPDTRASRVWEPELTLRVLAMPGEPLGFQFGVGMGFGD